MDSLRGYTMLVLLLALSLSCGVLGIDSTPAPEDSLPPSNSPQPEPTNSVAVAPLALNAEAVWAFGGGSQPFIDPYSITMDGGGNLYVTDSGGASGVPRIVKFDSDGQFLKEWTPQVNGNPIYDIGGVAADGQGNVYAIGNGLVLQYDEEGGLLSQWDNAQTGEFSITDIAVGNGNQVYVVDGRNTRILKFDGEGGFQTAWEGILSADTKPVEFGDIAVDSQGDVYVGVNGRDSRVIKLDSDGQILLEWTRNEDLRCSLPDDFERSYMGYLGGLWVDAQGHLYISDNDYGRVCVFDENGSYLGRLGEEGDQPGQMRRPTDVVGDNAGNIFVLEGSSGNLRVQKFEVK